MLFGLAEQGNAPKALMRVNRRGVPVLAIALSGLMTLLCVVVNYLLPQGALELLMSLVVAELLINWAMISLAHLKFRKAMMAQGVEPSFKSFWYPFSNYLCLAFVALIAVIMLWLPGLRMSVMAVPFWVLFIWICFRLRLARQRSGSSRSFSG